MVGGGRGNRVDTVVVVVVVVGGGRGNRFDTVVVVVVWWVGVGVIGLIRWWWWWWCGGWG